MEIVPHDFAPRDLVAGDRALDLVNTVTARNTPRPLDWLDSYGRFMDWAALAGVAGPAVFARLRKAARASPHRAAAALARAKRFREALHDVCAALIAEKTPPPAALSEVEAAWKRALDGAKLTPLGGHVEPRLDVARSGLDLILDTLALGSIELLGAFSAGRTRVCLGSHCGWLFIDTSKGGRRVWCDMATCGNVAKSRRHQARRARA